VARYRSNRRWTVALWGLFVLAATAGHLAEAGRTTAPAITAAAAVGGQPASANPAVLPARLTDDVRAATDSTPLRGLLLAALLGTVAASPAAFRRRASASTRDHRPLQARRHAIALRAPPLQPA
jgi:hypothetical protein